MQHIIPMGHREVDQITSLSPACRYTPGYTGTLVIPASNRHAAKCAEIRCLLGCMWNWSSGNEDTRMSCKLIELVRVEIKILGPLLCRDVIYYCEYKVK